MLFIRHLVLSLEKLWQAEKLVMGSDAICPTPGSVTGEVVASLSGNQLHFVTVKANHKYCCDSDCQMRKCSKLFLTRLPVIC